MFTVFSMVRARKKVEVLDGEFGMAACWIIYRKIDMAWETREPDMTPSPTMAVAISSRPLQNENSYDIVRFAPVACARNAHGTTTRLSWLTELSPVKPLEFV